MEKIRENVEAGEFNSLDQIEKELLYKIHMKSVSIGKGIPFEYILAIFKPKYSFDEIIKGLNSLRAKGYLRCKSFYESTFEYLEYYSEDMEEL